MSWNNGYERKKFEIAQRKQAAKYRKLGMTEEQISEMRKFDLEQFKSDRRFYSHTVALEPNDFDPSEDAEDKSPLFNLCSGVMTTSIDGSEAHSRLWWIEEIDNELLASRVKLLPESDQSLLSMYVIDGLNHVEISDIIGLSRQAVDKRFKKIEDFLKTGSI